MASTYGAWTGLPSPAPRGAPAPARRRCGAPPRRPARLPAHRGEGRRRHRLSPSLYTLNEHKERQKTEQPSCSSNSQYATSERKSQGLAGRRTGGASRTPLSRRLGRQAHTRAPGARGGPRGGSEQLGGTPHRTRLDDPRAFDRPPVSTRRRKFCLWSRAPARASTTRCSRRRVKVAGRSSKTTGRYLSFPRRRPSAVARASGDRAPSTPRRLGAPGRLLPIAPGLGDEPGLVQQLVTLQHADGVERRPAKSEGDVGPLTPGPPRLGVPRLPHPPLQGRHDHPLDEGGPPRAGVLPRQELVKAAPSRLPRARDTPLADEGQVGDRERMRAPPARSRGSRWRSANVYSCST